MQNLVATIFIAANAVITWARSLNHLSIGSAAGFGGSDRDFAAQHPQGAPQARRIWTLTPKTLPDFGSPSLCLLSLGEARESESPAGARPGSVVR